jgi:hypothetical protein
VSVVYAGDPTSAGPGAAAGPFSWTVTVEPTPAADPPAAPVPLWSPSPPDFVPALSGPPAAQAPPALGVAFALDVHHGPAMSWAVLKEVLAVAATLAGGTGPSALPDVDTPPLTFSVVVTAAPADPPAAPAGAAADQVAPLSPVNLNALLAAGNGATPTAAAPTLPAATPVASADGAGRSSAGPAGAPITPSAGSGDSPGLDREVAGAAQVRTALVRPGLGAPGAGDVLLAEPTAGRLSADAEEGRAALALAEPARAILIYSAPVAPAVLLVGAGVGRAVAPTPGPVNSAPSGAGALVYGPLRFGEPVVVATEAAAAAPAPGPVPVAEHEDDEPATRFLQLSGLLLQALLQRQGPLGAAAKVEVAPTLGPGVEGQLAVAEVLKEAREALSGLVRGFYRWLLERAPATGEEQGWVNALLAGQTQEQVLGALLSTAEFYARAGDLAGAGSADERFVQGLHLVLLQRPATPVELAAWLEALPGLDRAGVASCLLASAECRALQVAGLYQELFGHLPRPGDAAQWAATPFDLLSIRAFLQARPDLFGSAGSAGAVGSG